MYLEKKEEKRFLSTKETNFARSYTIFKLGSLRCLCKYKQEDLLDLITALLKFNCSLSTTVVAQCSFQSSL